MPAQKAISPLAKKYGNKLDKRIAAHKDDPIASLGFGGQLPPGVRGVAKITECRFEESKGGPVDGPKGEYQLRLSGVVVEPEFFVHDGNKLRVRGMQTRQFPIPLCDTKTKNGAAISFDDHVARMKAHFAGLGADCTGVATVGDLEQIAMAIEESETPVYFNFVTVAKNDNVNEYWNGNKGLENYREPEEGATPGVNDNTGQADGESGTGAAAGPDLDALAAAADANDEPARDQLVAIAEGLGMNTSDEALGGPFVSAGNFVEAVEAIRKVQSGEMAPDGSDPSAPASPAGPAVGDTGKYQLRDAKGNVLKDIRTKQPRAPIDVELLSMNGDDSGHIKNLVTGKPILDATGKKPLAVKLTDVEWSAK